MNYKTNNNKIFGRKYPRPTIKCLECNSDLILCWGDKLNIYCRHKPIKGITTNCKSVKNSLELKKNEYNFAKKLLYEYVSNPSNSLYLQKDCACCDNLVISSKSTFVIDHSIYDIAIFEDSKLKYGIKISDNSTKEDDFKTILLSPIEIIDKLDSDNDNLILFNDKFCLSNDHNYICSGNGLCLEQNNYLCNYGCTVKKCISLKCNNTFVKSSSELIGDENHCSSCVKKITEKREENKLKIDFRQCGQCLKYTIPNYNTSHEICKMCHMNNIKKEKEDEYKDFNVKELGEKLGYLSIVPSLKYYHPSIKCIEFAMKGSITPNIIQWNTAAISTISIVNKKLGLNDNIENNYDIWNILISRCICMRCEKECTISRGKPFCLSCFKHISKNNSESYGEKIKIKDSFKQEIRRRIFFIEEIDSDWKYGSACHFCGTDYRNRKDVEYLSPTGSLLGYTIWKEEKKCLCIICLDEQLKKTSVYDLLRSYI